MNTLQRIALGVGAGVLALAGTAYGGTKEDLDAVRDYVMKHPTRIEDISETINGVPLGEYRRYGVDRDNYFVSTSEKGTLIRFPKGNKFVYLCDHGNDFELDRAIITQGKRFEGFTETECMNNLDLSAEVDTLSLMRSNANFLGKHFKENEMTTRNVYDLKNSVAYNMSNASSLELNPELAQIIRETYSKVLAQIANDLSKS